MVLCYRCGCYGHIAPHCESERRRRSDEFYYDSPGSWSDQESDESDEWDEREEPVISDSINSAGVYVIVLDDGTRYVGKSANVNRRIFQHLNPKAIKQVAWCKKGGIRQAYAEPPITKPNADLSAWEQNETIAQMMKPGINLVPRLELPPRVRTLQKTSLLKKRFVSHLRIRRAYGRRLLFTKKSAVA